MARADRTRRKTTNKTTVNRAELETHRYSLYKRATDFEIGFALVASVVGARAIILVLIGKEYDEELKHRIKHVRISFSIDLPTESGKQDITRLRA